MVITEPTDYDILCGKDKTYSKHHGNKVFRAKIMSMTDQYKRAGSKPERMKLTRIIVDSLKEEHSARFLRSIQLSDGVEAWEEINDQQARDKTSHALRFALHKEGPPSSPTSTSTSSAAGASSSRRRGKAKSRTASSGGGGGRRKYRRKSTGDYASMRSPMLSSAAAAAMESSDLEFLPSSVASAPETRRRKRGGGGGGGGGTHRDLDPDDTSVTKKRTTSTTRKKTHKRSGSDGSGGTILTTTDSDAVSTLAEPGGSDCYCAGNHDPYSHLFEVVVFDERFVNEIVQNMHRSEEGDEGKEPSRSRISHQLHHLRIHADHNRRRCRRSSHRRAYHQGIHSSPARMQGNREARGGDANTLTTRRSFAAAGLFLDGYDLSRPIEFLGGSFREEEDLGDAADDDNVDRDRKPSSSSSRSHHHWNIDQLDMTVRSDDLNEFLDDDISCDWSKDDDNDETSSGAAAGGGGRGGEDGSSGDEDGDSKGDGGAQQYRDLVEL